VVVGTAAQADDDLMSEIEQLHRRGIRVRTLEMFYDEWLGKLPLSEVGRMALLTDVGGLHDTQYASFKRMIDLAFALIGTVVLVVVTPFVLIGNLFGNRGPLLYTQMRTGLKDEPFRILKFRTMITDPTGSTEWTADADPRVTPFGHLLRRLHVDELPQMLNVLQGSLSMVGPRPEQQSYVAELEEKLSYYSLRHVVKPGLTGWAQVKFRYGATERDAWEKLQYDLYYVRHQSLTFDLKTISRTIRQVVFAQGR
jgi:lipopolysaccharide/colanic/teichoic acid biosynthesis glycosyltransferase